MRTVLVAPVVLLLASAAACGGSDAKPSPVHTAANGTVFNNADAAFATDLLKQRAEELSLVDLTVGREVSPGFSAFADQAREVRSTDVQTVTLWLTDWDRTVPETVRDHANAHEGTGGHHDLEKLTGSAFEEAWVKAFLEELEDTDAIAEREQTAGKFSEAIDLAESTEASVDDESDQLEDGFGSATP
ncbi:DUF305 domain-containing protein [Nocardioides cavernaquae]|uniref:DUF305 domain-containing protein n=1 Tax=Nocardioides cavernaquae TaxID=2321396 RepID=A0A3A5HDC7_9ACTN|nr:DUF305 domain-containing protein [Nocardioides cavernaquae]RJS47505.1 DUF305 domain-containing protein [Nocardioides cavernaquae]